MALSKIAESRKIEHLTTGSAIAGGLGAGLYGYRSASGALASGKWSEQFANQMIEALEKKGVPRKSALNRVANLLLEFERVAEPDAKGPKFKKPIDVIRGLKSLRNAERTKPLYKFFRNKLLSHGVLTPALGALAGYGLAKGYEKLKSD